VVFFIVMFDLGFGWVGEGEGTHEVSGFSA
jgi:hypothetical protein